MHAAPKILRGRVLQPNVAEQHALLPDTPTTQGSSDQFTIGFYNTWSFVDHAEPADDPDVAEHEWEQIRQDWVKPGGEWFPDYREIRHVSGANGCSDAGGGRVNINSALSGAMSKGAVIVHNYDPRMGRFSKYLACHERRAPRGQRDFLWCLAGVEWSLLAGNTMAVVNEGPRSKAWLYGFRRQMHEGGIVPPMPRQHLNTHLHKLTVRVGRWLKALEQGNLTQPAYDSRIEESNRVRAAMMAAWDRQFGSAHTQQLSQAPRIRSRPVDPSLLDPAGPSATTGEPMAALDPAGSSKADALRRAGISEATATAEQIAEAREAMGMAAETPLSRFGEAKLAEYADALDSL